MKQAKQEQLPKLLRNNTRTKTTISFSGFFAWVFRFGSLFSVSRWWFLVGELGASFPVLSTFQNFRSSSLPVFPFPSSALYPRPVFPSCYPFPSLLSRFPPVYPIANAPNVCTLLNCSKCLFRVLVPSTYQNCLFQGSKRVHLCIT